MRHDDRNHDEAFFLGFFRSMDLFGVLKPKHAAALPANRDTITIAWHTVGESIRGATDDFKKKNPKVKAG